VNLYWFAAFLIWSAGMFAGGWEVESWRTGEKTAQTGEEQQKVTIAAEQNVIVKQHKAESITTRTEGNYEKTVSTIDGQYGPDPDSLHKPDPATSSSLPTVSRTTAGACSCPKASKAYHLTFKQCDEEEAKLVNLWAWIADQRK
jgi:hypothetical protein